jgi:hypothetical protein
MLEVFILLQFFQSILHKWYTWVIIVPANPIRYGVHYVVRNHPTIKN